MFTVIPILLRNFSKISRNKAAARQQVWSSLRRSPGTRLTNHNAESYDDINRKQNNHFYCMKSEKIHLSRIYYVREE